MDFNVCREWNEWLAGPVLSYFHILLPQQWNTAFRSSGAKLNAPKYSWWNSMCAMIKCHNHIYRPQCCIAQITREFWYISLKRQRVDVMNWKLLRLFWYSVLFLLAFSDHWPKSARFFGRARKTITIWTPAKGQWPKWVISFDNCDSIDLIAEWFIHIVDTPFKIFNVRVNHTQKSRNQRSTESNLVNLQINDEPGENLIPTFSNEFLNIFFFINFPIRSKSRKWQWWQRCDIQYKTPQIGKTFWRQFCVHHTRRKSNYSGERFR